MNIPSKETCFQLIRGMKMLDHIVAHSLRVCQVALLLVDRFNEKGLELNRNLVQAAALLHDITKTRSFETHENHAETAEILVMDAGYPEVSRIVGQHVQLSAYFLSDSLQEAEIINYADKRVLHDQVVSLEERFDYIMKRYAKTPSDRSRVHSLTEKTNALEERLFQRLDFTPDLLEEKLDPEKFLADMNAYFIK